MVNRSRRRARSNSKQKTPQPRVPGLNLDDDDDGNGNTHWDCKSHHSPSSPSSPSSPPLLSTSPSFVVPDRPEPLGYLVIDNQHYPLRTATGTVSDKKLTYTIHPQRGQLQIQTPLKRDKVASQEEKQSTLAYRSKTREELTIALENNLKEMDRLGDADNDTFDEKLMAAVMIERGRIRKALRKLTDGRGKYDSIWKGRDITLNAVQCPVWVMADGDARYAGGAVVQRRAVRLEDEKYVRKWGGIEHGNGDGEFRCPCGICVSKGQKKSDDDDDDDDDVDDGEVFICDALNHRVQVFDKQGNFLRKWGKRGTADGELRYPYDTDVRESSGDGDDGKQMEIYVTDCYHRVQVFDKDGNFLRKWGSEGDEDGQFKGPCGIRVYDSGDDQEVEVYVCELGNRRIQVFDKDGNFLRKWGREGSGDGELKQPNFIDVHTRADTKAIEVYVSDLGNDCVQVYDKQGKFLRKWGCEGDGDGEFRRPSGIVVRDLEDDGGVEVYVCDATNDRIQVFDQQGNHLRTLGGQGEGQGDGQFKLPGGLCLSTNKKGEEELFICDTNDNRIQVFK